MDGEKDDMMQTRTLGTQGLVVSAIGLGCMGMAGTGGAAAMYGVVDLDEATATIHRALELGVNFFDTAEIYGPYINEELLGLDVALTRLANVDARLAQVVELRYFAGLSEAEIAVLLDRSERSVRRDWQKARLYLLASLQD